MNKISFPAKVATIEISEICNAKCRWCTTGKQNRICNSKAQFMSADVFERGVCRLLECGWINKNTIMELYNWGEPFLNMQLNDILSVILKYGLQFRLSTNGSIYKKILPESIGNMEYLMISLPGMSQASYDKIHKLNYEKVRNNIFKFAADLAEYDAIDKLLLNFHVYQFNLSEIEIARHFSEELGSAFKANIAYFNDYVLFQDFLTKKISSKDLYEASTQLFLNIYADNDLNTNFQCPLWNNLCFDHEFNLIQCCRLTKNEQLGNLFNNDLASLIKKRENYPTCRECIESGQIQIIAERGNPEWYENVFLPELKNGKKNQELLKSFLSDDEKIKKLIEDKILNLYGKVYFDYGSGLSEDNIAKITISDDNRIRQRINLLEDCQSVRFDPVEGYACLVWNLQVRCESQFLQVISHNGLALNDVYVFRTDGPQIYFEALPVGTKWLEIEAEIICFEQAAWTKLVQGIEIIEQDKAKLLVENEQTVKEHVAAMQFAENNKQELIQSYEQKIADSVQNYEQIVAENQQAYEQSFRNMQQEFEQSLQEQQQQFIQEMELKEQKFAKDKLAVENNFERELVHYKEDYVALITQRDEYKEQVAYWQNCYNIINNSQFWKLTKPGRVIMDCLKYPFKKNKQSTLFVKGLRCLKENGFSYTWKKVQKKIGFKEIDDSYAEIVKAKFPCLGNIPKQNFNEPTDIIIPVYNGFAYLEQLFCTIEQTDLQYRLIIIDDQSTDDRVWPFLQEYAKKKDNVLLLRNDVNLGFVKTVNLGLSKSTYNVALVNTDVELPPNWLERLMPPIFSDKRVATTTPFTNCGTICSFPNFCEDNKLFWGMSVNEIDDAFQEYTPEYPIIPTGVGFCMGMSRKAIDKIGYLDAETFGKGYGEENDWCRRAAEAGFVNVHVDNLFVYHKHGGSFASEEKQALIKEHLGLLERKHPDYNRLVAEYCQLDPCAWLRNEVKKKLLNKFCNVPAVVAFNHSWGGGASMYLERERLKKLNAGKEFVQVEYVPQAGVFKVEYYYGNYYEKINIKGDFAELCQMLPKQIAEIWLNELVSYPDLYTTLANIANLAHSKNAYLLFLLHDFFAVCPTINLLNSDGKYCNIPDEMVCQNCLDNNKRFNDIHQYERNCGIVAWRKNWSEFFSECNEIRVFSKSSQKIFSKAYPNIKKEKITVRPHSIDYLSSLSGKKKFTNSLNVAVIGAIDEIKGVDVVVQMAELIKKYDLNVKITVIGYTHPEISKNLCVTTGKYSRASLPARILENDIDVVLIPSIWPETFSYTSQEAMLMGVPVACFDIGAPAERVKEYDKGIVIPQIKADLALQKIMKYAEEHIFKENNNSKKVLFITDNDDENLNYRVKCFQEKLLFCGVNSDLLLLDKAAKKNLQGINAVVFYGCSSVIGAQYLSKRAKKLGVKLFFDIDDFAFDTDIINGSGLSYEEKQQYLALAEEYREIMQLCDGLITSTESLAKYLRQSFVDKPVYVCRNSVNLEMETLLVSAGNKNAYNKGDTINLAYFSDFSIRDINFELIARPLANILKKYTNVKLKIYGCFHLPELLIKYKNQIEFLKSETDWRTKPEKIAQAYILLVPLENNIFNLCKSENKWVEAALAGCPVVASYNDELALVIENGVNGFLCKDGQEWESTLGSLIENADLRTCIAASAQKETLQTHLIRNSSNEVVKFILEIGLN